jgi:hypothetical protein
MLNVPTGLGTPIGSWLNTRRERSAALTAAERRPRGGGTIVDAGASSIVLAPLRRDVACDSHPI